jgi:hypothetical protein
LSRYYRLLLSAISLVGLGYVPLHAQPAPVQKTNPLKVYMHYMPWFETPATLGGNDWGFHWEFNNRNPNIVDAQGKRQIASHYYPKIGPYASRDPHVIEYHLLLMKYAGVDGVMINWYGQQGTNGDIGNLLTSSNAIVDRVDDAGLDFGVVLEDRFSGSIEHAKANVRYLRDNYFNRPNYIRQGAAQDPLMAIFGPITFQQPAQWTQILAEAGEDVNFATLWYEKNEAGANADGEYAWIYQDAARTHYQHQSDFYAHRAPTLGTAGGSAYPGFNDYYQEGGLGNVVPFEIPHLNGDTLASLLSLADTNKGVIDFLQLNTWNDFSEGTMFEPTVETGFSYLEQVQDFTGVPYGKAELELIYRLYRARKNFAGDAAKQALLDQAAASLAGLDVAAAQIALEAAAPAGDFDGDGDTDGSDFLTWQRQLGSTGLFPLNDRSADANGDGVVDGADLGLWTESAAAIATQALASAIGGANAGTHFVPEPAGASQAALACLSVAMMLRYALPR